MCDTIFDSIMGILIFGVVLGIVIGLMGFVFPSLGGIGAVIFVVSGFALIFVFIIDGLRYLFNHY